ncbi:hypothetical protein [Streptomyces atriruber]|uniref:hypothetical protein n=1 Tax=Streptomyces atriruber TaxID=545121 RepID=UPI0012FF19F0|nr:hypothetical protein [Streptomyces atriruber]
MQPIVARPWGAYIAGGCVAALVLVFVMIGLAILAVALAVATVCLTACTIALRSMWRQYLKEK